MVLVIALAAVLSMISGVRPSHIERFFTAFGGSLGGSSQGSGPEKFNLCKTRVHAIIWPDGKKIEEFKRGMTMKWLAMDPEPREIGYIDVEKWLGEHCRFTVMTVEGSAPSTGGAPLTVEFIDTTALRIEIGPSDHFLIEGRLVYSPEFSQALRELRSLGQFQEKY